MLVNHELDLKWKNLFQGELRNRQSKRTTQHFDHPSLSCFPYEHIIIISCIVILTLLTLNVQGLEGTFVVKPQSLNK